MRFHVGTSEECCCPDCCLMREVLNTEKSNEKIIVEKISNHKTINKIDDLVLIAGKRKSMYYVMIEENGSKRGQRYKASIKKINKTITSTTGKTVREVLN